MSNLPDNVFGSLRVAKLPLSVDGLEQPVWVASYTVASQFLTTHALAQMPLPLAGQAEDDQRTTGLIIDGPLPNFAAAFAALQCQDKYQWVAIANFQLPKLCVEPGGKGAAVVVASRSDALAPGTVIRWHDDYCELPRLQTLDSLEREAYFVYELPTDQEDEQVVHINAGTRIDPRRIADFVIPLPQDIRKTKLTLSYAGPTWLHAYLAIGAAQAARFDQIAVFNLRTPNPIPGRSPGSIVVYSKGATVPGGTFIDNGHLIPAGRQDTAGTSGVAGLAVAIIGLPQSGKSVLARALYALTADLPGVFAIEANPDGEGMYFQYVTGAMADQVRHKWKFHPELGDRYHDQILALKAKLNITWVPLGGLPSPESKRTLEACTHAILLQREASGESAKIAAMEQSLAAWKRLCQETKVPIIACLTSKLDQTISTVAIDEQGVVTGIAAGLNRGDLTAIERCRPIAVALLKVLSECSAGLGTLLVDREC